MLITPIPTREVSKLLKTGQTTQYAGMLDDGYYQKGVAKEYLVLSTGQYSGTVNITLNGKTDVKSNNCVLDLKTGRMWSRYVSASVGPGSDGKLPWTTNVNGEGIFSYCLAANVAPGLALFMDWRIPNITEINSIIVWEVVAGAIVPDPTAFPGFPSTVKIPISTTGNGTWKVSFQGNSNGPFGDFHPSTETGPAILVRGG